MKTAMRVAALIVGASVLAAMLCGCGDGWDAGKVRAQATTDFPGAEITVLPGKKYAFLVRKADNSIFIAEYMGNTTDRTSLVPMFPARP